MDSTVNSAVAQSLVMQQAQTAQQAQMEVFKEALETQKDQVSALVESAGTQDRPAQQQPSPDTPLGSLIDTFV